MDPVEPGIACGSDTAHLSIFGFDPLNAYTGRGAFETMGAGLCMKPGEIGFKCNFANVDFETGRVILRRVDKDFAAEANELCEYLQKELSRIETWPENEGISVTIKHATDHRCGIKIGKVGASLSDNITGTDPLYDEMPLIKCHALYSDDNNANQSSEIVQRLSDEISRLLSTHPLNLKRSRQGKPVANAILFRGCSRTPDLSDFNEQNCVQWNPAMMARTCIISGIGNGIGFRNISSANHSKEAESLSSILRDMDVFLDDLRVNRSCRFGFFHIKAVDEASHDYDYKQKIELIENIDKIINRVIEKIMTEFISDEFYIVLTGDHTTLCRIGEHSCEPVPFLVSCALSKEQIGNHEAQKLSKCFINNNLGRFSGKSVIEFLKQIMK